MKCSAARRCLAAVLFGSCCTLLSSAVVWPVQAEDQSAVKELMGRAQTEAEKKAVEDLIDKLKVKPAEPAKSAGKPSTAIEAPASESKEAHRNDAAASETAAHPAAEPAKKEPIDEAAVGGPSGKPDETPKPATKTSSEETSGPPAEQPAASTPQTSSEAETKPDQIVEKAERKELPTVDLEVFFAYDSAAITPAAATALVPLGRALGDPRLADGKFLIAGHTDAKGSSAYNLRLSQRRAEAVREFLLIKFGIEPGRLIAKGFGSARLKLPQSPRAQENRRVQIVNFSDEAR